MAHHLKSFFPHAIFRRSFRLLIPALVLMAGVSARAQEWSCVQHDPQHTGRSPRLISNVPHVEKWRTHVGGSILGTPVIRADGSIVVANGANKCVSAWDAAGKPLWSYPTIGKAISAPAVLANGTTLCTDLEGWIYQLSAGGTLSSSAQNSSTPKTEKRIICDMTPRPNGGYATGDWLHELVLNTGGATSQLFALDPNVYPHAPVTFNSDGTRVYYPVRPDANTTQILCVDPSSGSQVWSKSYTPTTGSKLTSQMSGIAYDQTNSRLFFCANYHSPASSCCYLYSLSATTGTTNTNFPVALGVGSYCIPALAPDGLSVYVTTLDGRLLKIDAITGATIWTYTSNALAIRGSAVVDQLGRVTFADMSGAVHCLDAVGNLLWKYDGDGSVITSTPAIASDGDVVVATANGDLIRLTPQPFVIPYLPNKTPTLDGVLSPGEWDGAWKISDINASTPHVNPGWDILGNALSKADASYDLYVMHNGDSLFVAFDVNDDTIMASQAPVPNTPPPANGTEAQCVYSVWYDDCTEVYIDADHDGVNEAMVDKTNWAEGIHIHYGVLGHIWDAADVSSQGGTFGTLWHKGWWGAAKLRPGGYVHEYKLKLSAFDTQDGPGFTPLKPGDTIGFDAMLNDDDFYNPPNNNDRREDELVWWGSEQADYDTNKYAQTWPSALLSPTPAKPKPVTAAQSWKRFQ